MSDKTMVDIQRLSNLEKEIEILEKRKNSAQYELDRIEQECVKREREAEIKVEQELSKIKLDSDYRNSLLLKRSNELDEREKTLVLLERDFKTIHQEAEDLKIEKTKIAAEWKEVGIARSAALEAKHTADLLIEQYNVKLSEIKV